MPRADSGVGRNLKDNYRVNDSISARDLNVIVRALKYAYGINGTTVRFTANGLRIDGGGEGFPWGKTSFGYSQTAGAEVRIYSGTLRLHGLGSYFVTQHEVTLTGAECWIYLHHTRDHATTDIRTSSTEPQTETSALRVPLFMFTLTPGGSYVLARICNIGDINFDLPLR